MKSLQLSKPHMLVVVGIPGSGKTFFGSQFSEMFGAPYVDYNHYRRVVGNVKEGTRLASHALGQLFKTKHTIMIEGPGITRSERDGLVKISRKYGYEILFIWVQTEPDTCQQRTVHAKTPTLTEDEFIEQANAFEVLHLKEKFVVISGKHNYSSQAKVVLKKLASLMRTDKPVSTDASRHGRTTR